MQALKNRIAPIIGGLKKKTGLEKADQILLGLTHSGSQLLEQTLKRIESNPGDLIGRVGRSVLERAQQVRSQMTAMPIIAKASDGGKKKSGAVKAGKKAPAKKAKSGKKKK